MAAREDTSLVDVARLLAQDPAISARLMVLANSTLYRASTPAGNVEQAIGRLGISATATMVQMIANRSLYLSNHRNWAPLLEQLWLESLATAWASRLLAGKIGLDAPDTTFSVGLLRNAGKLILLQSLAAMNPDAVELDTMEGIQDVQGFLNQNHARFGAALLKRWGFGENYQHAALHGDKPEKAGAFTRELLTVHLADQIAHATGGEAIAQMIEKNAVAKFLALDRQAIEEIHSATLQAVSACHGDMTPSRLR